ncbi:hypothetical protein ZYGR_0N03770 [Zygosaccharomyces rouxii]|uniref:Meiotically up-regulated protein Msb1/Mug8 domain-containing protein n=1 Tax=Zygosaccharomyces rouxii TaxID=4956 RepID=A0A1Q2ZZX6_ZYGRO|nr:hypothetical protein ZYGR_0N03770 [Zygosaccharomyces rouxii]
MFKNFKARIRSGSSQLKSSGAHGLDKLAKSGSKRSASGSAATTSSNNRKSRNDGHDDGIDQQRSISAPGTSQPGYQSHFADNRSPRQAYRPPPIGAGDELTYSPVPSSKSFPKSTRHYSQENPYSERNSLTMLGGPNHYVYDNAAYDTNDKEFNIFSKPDGITPCSSRLVVQSLTSAFKESISHVGDTKVLQQVVKPNLHHFSKEEVQEVKRLICKLFPYDGCTLKDQALKKSINESFGDNVIRLTVALRIIWSSFPRGIIPWDSYYKFTKWESQTGFPPESFHFRFSKFLPDRNYTFCTFAFLEFLLCILLQKNKLMLDKSIQMDLIFTAGATAFVRDPSYCSPANEETPPVIRSYYQRGNALHRLFVGYIRSLNHERKMTDVYLLDIFQIEQYPPRPYKARSAKALTLTIPKGNPDGNDFTSLISQAASAKKRFYASSSSFSRIENAFLDQFEEQTLRVIMSFFSESSNRYITTFDDGFDADFLQGASKRNKSHTRKVSDDNMVATWLQMAKEQNGFDELLDVLENNHMPEGGTLALGAPAATMGPTSRRDRTEAADSSVRIGKTDITEWIINSWKYEMFMSRVQNTLLIKLTKKVDECNWLVLSCEENVNMNPKAIPPPAKHPPIPKERPHRLQQPKVTIREPATHSLPSVKESVPTDFSHLPVDLPIPESFVEAEPKPESKPLPNPAEESLKGPISETVREPSTESNADASVEPTKVSNASSVVESTKVSNASSVAEPTKESNASLAEEPIKEHNANASVEPTEESNASSVVEPTEKSNASSVMEPTKESNVDAAEEPTKHPVKSSVPSNDALIAKLNNVGISPSAIDTRYEKNGNRTARSSRNILGDLLESCYSGNEVEAIN